MKNVLAVLVFFIVVVFLFISYKSPYQYPVYIGGQEVLVSIADTDKTREKGLSNSAALLSNTGMLFVFETSEMHGFWMKEMKYPIDIIWLDQEKRIIHIEKSVEPSSYPQIFVPTTPAKYVLETPAGFTNKNLISKGDFAVWDFR